MRVLILVVTTVIVTFSLTKYFLNKSEDLLIKKISLLEKKDSLTRSQNSESYYEKVQCVMDKNYTLLSEMKKTDKHIYQSGSSFGKTVQIGNEFYEYMINPGNYIFFRKSSNTKNGFPVERCVYHLNFGNKKNCVESFFYDKPGQPTSIADTVLAIKRLDYFLSKIPDINNGIKYN